MDVLHGEPLPLHLLLLHSLPSACTWVGLSCSKQYVAASDSFLGVLTDAHHMGSLLQCACSTCFAFKLGGDSLQQHLTRRSMAGQGLYYAVSTPCRTSATRCHWMVVLTGLIHPSRAAHGILLLPISDKFLSDWHLDLKALPCTDR